MTRRREVSVGVPSSLDEMYKWVRGFEHPLEVCEYGTIGVLVSKRILPVDQQAGGDGQTPTAVDRAVLCARIRKMLNGRTVVEVLNYSGLAFGIHTQIGIDARNQESKLEQIRRRARRDMETLSVSRSKEMASLKKKPRCKKRDDLGAMQRAVSAKKKFRKKNGGKS